MRKSSKSNIRSLSVKAGTPGRGAALLWDESFLWGLMACRALQSANLPYDLIRAGDIREGRLEGYKMLFVPGGWASNKAKSLGDEGINEIQKFVHSGGSYLGFCGGAGLATLDGIGLLKIKRRPTKERVPSFSGRIRLSLNAHSIWEDITEPLFHAWWPSQFLIEDRDINILATYGEALPDSFSSDLNVGDVERHGDWPAIEDLYRINLDPARLLNDPAVVEGAYGKGKVILSLIHFDTPDDANGAVVLKNLWGYLRGRCKMSDAGSGMQDTACVTQDAGNRIREKKMQESCVGDHGSSQLVTNIISELESSVNGMIDLGRRNFLWFWRNPMLLQWRRGVRGLEYCTLYIMVKEIEEILRCQSSSSAIDKDTSVMWPSVFDDLSRIKKLLLLFVEKAEKLLILERYAMQNGHLTYEKCDDPEIREIRTELFSKAKSHGGLFKDLIDEVDTLLYSLLSPKRGTNSFSDPAMSHGSPKG